MKGVHSPLTDPTSTVRAEVVEVGPQIDAPIDPGMPSAGGRWKWLRLAGLVTLLLVGIAVMPGGQQPASTTVDLTLPQPVVATSTIPVAPRAVAVVTDETFPLTPVADLSGFGRVAGPVEFGGRYWVAAGGPSPANSAVVFSSADGAAWSRESVLVATDRNLRVWDMVRFQSHIVIFGTTSGVPPTPQWDLPERLVAWISDDGQNWTSQSIRDVEGIGYWNVVAASGDEQLMVVGDVFEAYGDLIYPAVPSEYQPALEAGRLFATAERRPDQVTVKVMAPPGIVVFSTEVPVSSPRLFSQTRVLWSDDLKLWDVIDPSLAGSWGLAWSPDVGFVRQGVDGGTVTSRDGQFWERSPKLPDGNYLSSEHGLMGMVYTTGPYADLLLLQAGVMTTIELPSEMFVAEGWPWIEPGPDGLIAAVTRWDMPDQTEPEVVSGELVLRLEAGTLVVYEGSEYIVRVPLTIPSPFIQTSYDPAGGTITITPDGGRHLTIPLSDLADLWSGGTFSGRTEFYRSADGLTWSKGETAVISDALTLLGGTDDGFLIGVGANAVAGWEAEMTVLRTGSPD